ncbi:hypothetical protein HKD24_09220 [Gluconobacter sp. LMG 31484]|uniref:Uncharacterized protein n=1 Tax=Gluconobacter vitians TaxID=2728102 RepID=A0ABR9Y729_9PROT|nr:hypothetical protein [Gluconobacter vitians]MBF0859393.1 hypothetical protein [Gluconobacter vitians]
MKMILAIFSRVRGRARRRVRHHSTVCGWRKIPPCHALTIAQMAGVSVHVIRPDVFGPEQNREQAA